ncbi:hypothetical protein [Palleronia caenipelagi]|uniref:Uncharacterized protein n=1 Tax=Palleronia caenipelagi TaxID=2489174 RepID=A0A547Q8U7_9RHOB|nr:hypothetical protein [Palleronia caenipelagi]TRD22798.1 hypothetical protein FEV53_03195 [Palleronia caenipelagi]
MTPKTRPSAPTADRRKAGLIALIVIAALSIGAAFASRTLPSTTRAVDYATRISIGASATYVTLRTLNAFLSSAQEVEVGVSVVGQGSAQPLKVLEPIDDTIERIAGVVFAVMLVSGVLAVAMGPLAAVGFALVAGPASSGPRCWRAVGRGHSAACPAASGCTGLFWRSEFRWRSFAPGS